MDERIAQYAEAVTAPFAYDPELRLLLRKQAITRLTERARVYLTAGSGWEEGVEHALADGGTPEQFAAEQQRSNAAMFARRARTRRRLCWLLAAGVAGVWGNTMQDVPARHQRLAHQCVIRER